MDWSLLLQPAGFPNYVAAAIMLALAAWLVKLDSHQRTNRAFALFLGFRALNMVFATFSVLALPDPPLARIFWRIAPFFTIATPFAILYFVSLYPRPRGFLSRRILGPVAVIGTVAVFEYLYLFDFHLIADLAVHEAGFLYVVRYQPFIAFFGLLVLAYGVAALVLAREYTRMEAGAARSSLFVVLAAFALTVVYDVTGEVFCTSPNCPSAIPGWGMASVPILAATVPLVIALLLLVRHAATVAGPAKAQTRSHVTRLLLVLPLPLLTNVFLFFFQGDTPAFADPRAIVLIGLWRLSLPLLVVYALVKHQLFDLDVKIKLAIKGSTVAGAFMGVFFIGGEGIEQLIGVLAGQAVGDNVGLVAGLAAAGLLTLATGRVRQAAQRVADATMPGVKSVDEIEDDERHAFYREQAKLAMIDGNLTPKEERLLQSLGERLGLPREEAERVKEEVARAQTKAGSGAAAA